MKTATTFKKEKKGAAKASGKSVPVFLDRSAGRGKGTSSKVATPKQPQYDDGCVLM